MVLSKTYHAKFNEIAAEYPNKIAVKCNEKSLTYQELHKYSDYTAYYLYQQGVRPYDKVALWMSNSIEWVVIQLALSKLGVINVPLNTRMRTYDASYIVEQSDSIALIISMHQAADFENMATDIKGKLVEKGKGLQIFCVDSQERSKNGINYFNCLGYLAEKENNIISDISLQINGDDLFAFYYTSGTTGYPKGAMLVQGAVTRHTYQIAECRNITSEDVLFLPLPLFGVMALQGLFGLILKGGTVVLQDGFNAKEALEIIEKDRCTIIYSVEGMCQDFFKELIIQPSDLSHIKMVSVSPASKETIKRIHNEWKVPIIRGYGLSEATSVVSSDRYNEPLEVILNTNGYPLKDIQVRIMELEHQRECKTGEIGEIWVKGYTVMKGYYNKKSETEEVLTKDGWLRTNDVGFLDEAGRLVFVDRIKDIYKSGGFNVSTTEIENFIKEHPNVIEVAVIGVSDPKLDEIGVAFVIRDFEENIDEEEIIRFCKDKIASFKIPRKVIFVNELPKTSTGKIRKVELKEKYKNNFQYVN